MRAELLDDRTADFPSRHPSATVLHLACGPAARARLLDVPAGDYRLVHASVTDDGWWDGVPADRPVVAVFEGLTMYLTEDGVRGLVRRVTGRGRRRTGVRTTRPSSRAGPTG